MCDRKLNLAPQDKASKMNPQVKTTKALQEGIDSSGTVPVLSMERFIDLVQQVEAVNVSVLLSEVIELLAPPPNETFFILHDSLFINW